MKPSIIITLSSLSLLATATAIPAPAPSQKEQQPKPYPYSIRNLTLTHSPSTNIWEMNLLLTLRSLYAEALDSTPCHTTWINGTTPASRISPQPCANASYAIYFPDAVADVETYWFAVRGPRGEAAEVISYGPKYRCWRYGPGVPEVGVDVECAITNGGEFYLQLI